MRWPRVAFVSAPEVDAEVLFDFNDDLAGTYPSADDFSLGVPELQGDPDGIGVELGLRTLSFTLVVESSRREALRVQQGLARQIGKRTGWLFVQLDETSEPHWFKTWRADPGDLSFEHIYNDRGRDHWQIPVSIPADAYALDERVTLPTVTISNDPAAATNPCFYRLPEIQGDAPAPLRIAAKFSASLNQSDVLWSLAPVDQSDPIVWPIGTGDSWAAGADTGAGVADAAFSGGSYRSVSFATTPGMATRLSGDAPAEIPSGRYKVMLRFARSDTSSTFAFRLGYNDAVFGDDIDGQQTVVMNRQASASAGHATWVDLGVKSFPKYHIDIDVPGFSPKPRIALQAQRLSGSGSARLDSLLLIPIEVGAESQGLARTLSSAFPAIGPQSGDNRVYWDSDAEQFTRENGFGFLQANIQPFNAGQFLQVYPGQPNVLHHLQQTRLTSGLFGSTDNSDDITRTTQVTLSYHPRRLYLGEDD